MRHDAAPTLRPRASYTGYDETRTCSGTRVGVAPVDGSDAAGTPRVAKAVAEPRAAATQPSMAVRRRDPMVSGFDAAGADPAGPRIRHAARRVPVSGRPREVGRGALEQLGGQP